MVLQMVIYGQPVRLEYRAAEDIMTGPDMDDMPKVGVRDPHIRLKRRDEMTFDQDKNTPTRHQKSSGLKKQNLLEDIQRTLNLKNVTFEKFGEHGSDFSEVEEVCNWKS